MMDKLTSMAVFVRTVERGSLSAAAAEFGISATMAGKHVQHLEQRLGARLLNRTTRRQSLSEVGRLYYERCRQVLADVDAAEASAEELQATPRGTLRITAPITFGSHSLTPALAEFLQRYPDVRVELELSNRVTDLIDEGFDAAIRIGSLPASTLVARPLAPYRMALAATPGYIAAHGLPRRAADLARHECLGFQPGMAEHWSLHERGVLHQIDVTGRLQVNNGEALRRAALAGSGIICQPEVLLAGDFADGRLIRLLANAETPARPMHLIYVRDRRPMPKLQRFVEFVIERFGHAPTAGRRRR